MGKLVLLGSQVSGREVQVAQPFPPLRSLPKDLLQPSHPGTHICMLVPSSIEVLFLIHTSREVNHQVENALHPNRMENCRRWADTLHQGNATLQIIFLR